LEDVLRISIVYLSLYILLRYLRRETGGLGIPDVLLLVLIADALQNGMVGEYSSLTNALIIGTTLIGWSLLLDWLGFRFPRIQRILKPAPRLLIRDGQLLHTLQRQLMLTDDELMGQLRLQGVARVEDVAAAYVESSGQISVLPKEGRQTGARKEAGPSATE
jgi:uncharacterized membrane protein YcaP (DUF421 family)